MTNSRLAGRHRQRYLYILISTVGVFVGISLLIYCGSNLAMNVGMFRGSSSLLPSDVTIRGDNPMNGNYLCSFRPNELSSVIWSHRAHYSQKPSLVDGSSQSLHSLLNAGITNFDIDVSYKFDNFYVAHPTLIDSFSDAASIRKVILSVSDFLRIIANHNRIAPLLLRPIKINDSSQSKLLLPFLTMEPKFGGDEMLWTLLIDELQRSVHLSPRQLAIIVNNPEQQSLVNSLLQEYRKSTDAIIAVAMAFRSIPKSDSDFNWQEFVVKPSRVKEGINSPCCWMPDNHSPIRQILMPDWKLLSRSFVNRREPEAIGIGNQTTTKVIPWLVDSTEQLLQALQQQVDGVISNEPIKLLHYLEDKYRRECMPVAT